MILLVILEQNDHKNIIFAEGKKTVMRPAAPKKEDSLETVSQSRLDEIIKKHRTYLKGIKGGARAVLKFKDMSGLDFRGADFSQADFTGSVLNRADLSGGTFTGTSFFACDLRKANLSDANFSRADFRGAFVAGANLTGADLKEADLREGKIMEKGKDGILQEKERRNIPPKMNKTVFTGAKLTETNLSGSKATAADFSDADLSGVIVKDADFSGANFEGANLSQANFTGSNLENTNMRASIMSGAVLDHAETGGCNLKEALHEDSMGTDFKDLVKSLPQLLKDHSLWVQSAGAQGTRLDLSGYDLRHVEHLHDYSLTAIKAVAANFLNQDLTGIEMQSAQLDRADFRDCKLVDADLRGSSLKNANLSRANLTTCQMAPLKFKKEDGSTWLQRINLSGANMRHAVITGADLRDAIMMGADLSYAVLIDCDLRRADLTGAILNGADLSNARLDDSIIDPRYKP